MPENRITELEAQLATAIESVARLTLSNQELTTQLADQAADNESRERKLKRNSKRDQTTLRDQLASAQNRRG